MWIRWIYYCGIFFILAPVQGTHRPEPLPCNCHGKSNSCIQDTYGPRCLNCQENTEGWQCERCKEGFYRQRAGESCLPCNCSSAGSSSPRCDSRGVCSCKPGVQGNKCDRCDNGAPVTSIGCTRSCWPQSSSQLVRSLLECLPCLCHGHSNNCSQAEGYSVHTISSNFNTGTEAWRVAPANGISASAVHFQWSPRLKSLEVFSDNSVPVYLLAPASYLGNQMLSYGQTLSFSLRLDRGLRRPSTADVVLEGAGLRVAASLADLHGVIPCGKKMEYSFRLNEQPDSKWQPRLTSLQFQSLLQNITAIMIRGTFGRNSRSYLDDVQLVSASQGPGTPAQWVGKCSCPVGHEGQFCEQCAPGYRRMDPMRGAFSPCVPCSCHGDCNPNTGECLSGDDSAGFRNCPVGYYQDPWKPLSCLKCPCRPGVDCSLTPATSQVKCHRCPLGITGPRCNICEDGFFGDPLGENGPQQPCRRCQCNGQLSSSATGSCDRLTGKCLRCLNNTMGFSCESCQDGFHRSDLSESCKACSCNPLGSLSNKCNQSGQCMCREGFEGLKCEHSACPVCFDHVKHKLEQSFQKLHDMETLLKETEGDGAPASRAQLDTDTQLAERLLVDLQMTTNHLTDTENGLLTHLEGLSQAESREASRLQAVVRTLNAMQQQKQQYQKHVSEIDLLIQDIRQQLNQAKRDIRNAELPLRDADGDTNTISALAEKAVSLAKKYRGEVEMIDQATESAIAEAKKAQDLMRSVMLGEDRVAELVDDLKKQYKRNTTHVMAMTNLAAQLSSSAFQENRAVEDMLRQMSWLEPQILDKYQMMDAAVSRLEALKNNVENSLSGCQDLKTRIQADQSEMSDLLVKGKAAEQIHSQLHSKAEAAKAYADASLRDISQNLNGLADVYDKLQGFNEELTTGKAEAEKSIKKLKDIAATIQGAVSSNSQSIDVLGSVQGDLKKALETFRELEDSVAYTEEIPPTLQAMHDMLKEVTALKDDVNQLKFQAMARMTELTMEADHAKQWEMKARQASSQAAGSYDFVKTVKDSVDETLQGMNNLLSTSSSSGWTGSWDKRFNELELLIANTRSMVKQQLLPRLQNLEELEESHKARTMSLNTDIDNILMDIRNLQDIQKTFPVGCFNSPAIERP